ncbi:hypothetical protein Dda_7840 [Drechslerella dactyloides]|uniref:Uncharacterized protein n=1 Tax=Drechslerella dactyloides TaxID=74499 RepID=A0AAD6NG83_DREDA|nr:hypothetical protein Dda_7840 [Drechslerella dactyloides]
MRARKVRAVPGSPTLNHRDVSQIPPQGSLDTTSTDHEESPTGTVVAANGAPVKNGRLSALKDIIILAVIVFAIHVYFYIRFLSDTDFSAEKVARFQEASDLFLEGLTLIHFIGPGWLLLVNPVKFFAKLCQSRWLVARNAMYLLVVLGVARKMSDQSTQPLLQPPPPPPYDGKATYSWPSAASEKDPEKLLEAGGSDLENGDPSTPLHFPRLRDLDLPLKFHILRAFLLTFFFGSIGSSIVGVYATSYAVSEAARLTFIICCYALSVTVLLWTLTVAYSNPAQYFGSAAAADGVDAAIANDFFCAGLRDYFSIDETSPVTDLDTLLHLTPGHLSGTRSSYAYISFGMEKSNRVMGHLNRFVEQKLKPILSLRSAYEVMVSHRLFKDPNDPITETSELVLSDGTRLKVVYIFGGPAEDASSDMSKQSKASASSDNFLARWGPWALWTMLFSHWAIDHPLNSANNGRIVIMSFFTRGSKTLPPPSEEELEQMRTSATYAYVYGYATAVDVCNKNNICLLSNWLPVLIIFLSHLAATYFDTTVWANHAVRVSWSMVFQLTLYCFYILNGLFIRHWENVGRAQEHQRCGKLMRGAARLLCVIRLGWILWCQDVFTVGLLKDLPEHLKQIPGLSKRLLLAIDERIFDWEKTLWWFMRAFEWHWKLVSAGSAHPEIIRRDAPPVFVSADMTVAQIEVYRRLCQTDVIVPTTRFVSRTIALIILDLILPDGPLYMIPNFCYFLCLVEYLMRMSDALKIQIVTGGHGRHGVCLDIAILIAIGILSLELRTGLGRKAVLPWDLRGKLDGYGELEGFRVEQMAGDH